MSIRRASDADPNSNPDPDATLLVPGISAGEYHTCAVVEGAVRCWGNASNKQTGEGKERNSGYLVFPDGFQPSLRERSIRARWSTVA